MTKRSPGFRSSKGKVFMEGFLQKQCLGQILKKAKGWLDEKGDGKNILAKEKKNEQKRGGG